MESLRNLADWATNNPILTILIILGGMGGTLSFFFKINSFSQLVTVLKKKADWISENILLPAGNLLLHLTRVFFEKLYFLFFQYRYKHLIRSPFYLLIIAVVFIKIWEYQYNKNRYKICLLYDSYANGLGLRDLVKETFEQQLDKTGFRYKLYLIEARYGADLSGYDLVVSTVLNTDIIVSAYAGFRNDNSLLLDLTSSSKAKILSRYNPGMKVKIVQFLPDEKEKLDFVSAFILNENSVLLDKGEWYSKYDYTFPDNVRRLYDYEYNLNLITPLIRQSGNVLIASQMDLPVLNYLGNSKSRLIFLNPQKYYDTNSVMNSKPLQVVPFKDSVAIVAFNRFNRPDRDSYFTLISLYIKGFLSYAKNYPQKRTEGLK